MDQDPGHRRRRQTLRRLLPRPRRPHAIGRHLLLQRAAERAANREEAKVREGAWHDHSRGQVTFSDYVATVWLPSKQVETSTLAAYRSYLDKHFIPVFGRRPMGNILPSEIQRWVTTATANGLLTCNPFSGRFRCGDHAAWWAAL